MRIRRSIARLRDQRGVALPMATLALLILSALIIGFSVLASTEPTIAANQLMVAQARAAAEAGLERAIWALGHPDDPSGIPVTFVTAPAPYDGSQFIALGANGNTIGGFRVSVYPAAHAPECPGPLAVAERCIVARGWAPNDTTAAPKGQQKIAVVVFNPQLAFRDPPAALSVRGELQLGGNTLVDSRSDQSCGKKLGTLSLGITDVNGNAADVWGATDNNNTRNEITDAGGAAVPADAHDIVKNVANSVFDPFMMTDADIDALRAYAKSRNTYYQGSISFSSGSLPNGIVFVDTTTGRNITGEGVTPATPSTEFASAEVHGNAPAGIDGDGIFHGILFVNGTVTISGNFQMKGSIYSQNDIVYHGTGNGGVSGALVSRNIRDTSSTSIDSDLNGNSNITYNCTDAKTGGGSVHSVWSLRGGTYRELPGS